MPNLLVIITERICICAEWITSPPDFEEIICAFNRPVATTNSDWHARSHRDTSILSPLKFERIDTESTKHIITTSLMYILLWTY